MRMVSIANLIANKFLVTVLAEKGRSPSGSQPLPSCYCIILKSISHENEILLFQHFRCNRQMR